MVNHVEALETLALLVFIANKHITTGEGGALLTNNKKILKKSKS